MSLKELSSLVHELYSRAFPKEAYALDWEHDTTLLDADIFAMAQQYVAFRGDTERFCDFYKKYPRSRTDASAPPALVALKKAKARLQPILSKLSGEGLEYFQLHDQVLNSLISSLEDGLGLEKET